MKKRIALILVLSLIITSLLTVAPVKAAAYGSKFVTSITYQNVGSAEATISISFYPKSSSTSIVITQPALAAGAATSLYVGGVSSVASGFMGSAVLSSNQPIVATLVQVGSGTVKNRPLSGSFSAGSSHVLIPTVLKNTFEYTSVFSIQNVDPAAAAAVTVKFVPVSGSTISYNIPSIPAGSVEYIDMGTFSGIISPTFNGSVQIDAVQFGTMNPGAVVASSMELQITGDLANAFEGASQSAATVFMPSALCKFGPNKDTVSAYAVQNTATTNIQVSVNYSNGNIDGPATLAPGAKKSFDGCGAGNPIGFIGSAKITATGGEIVAIGKVYGGGMSTAFLGFNSGSNKVALPYVRWTESQWVTGARQRAYIAIQNVGTTDLAAGSVTVKYYDKSGILVGTHTLGAIAAGAKTNSNPMAIGAVAAEFGAYTDGSYGGAAVVEGPTGSQLAVVVRIQSYAGGGNSVAEDYTGVPIQ
jgi:hypothetical protein